MVSIPVLLPLGYSAIPLVDRMLNILSWDLELDVEYRKLILKVTKSFLPSRTALNYFLGL